MIRSILFLFILFFLFFTSASHAYEIDLRSPGYSMEHVPLQEQFISDCYAYAASMSIDAFRKSYFPDAQGYTDPLYIAIRSAYAENKNKFLNDEQLLIDYIRDEPVDLTQLTASTSMDGGYIENSIQESIRNGICINEQVGTFFSKFSTKETPDFFDSLYFFYNIYAQYDGLFESGLITDEDARMIESHWIVEKLMEIAGDYKGRASDEDLKKLQIFLNQIFADPAMDGRLNSLQFLDRFTRIGCEKKQSLKGKAHLSPLASGWSLQDYQKLIHYYFEKYPHKKLQPLNISYCKKQMNEGGDECGAHASLLIGYRTEAKNVQYLIRDTEKCEGQGCDGLDRWVDASKFSEYIRYVSVVYPDFKGMKDARLLDPENYKKLLKKYEKFFKNASKLATENQNKQKKS